MPGIQGIIHAFFWFMGSSPNASPSERVLLRHGV